MSDVALNRIRDNLDQSWNDWDVTEGELKDINQTLAGLSPAERNEVVSRLSDEELAHWADEVSGWVNGLSTGDRQDLLNQLAGSLDGTQLARVAGAFGTGDVTAAVVNHASPQQKLEYIQALQGQVEASPQSDLGFGSTTFTYGNEQAHAVADVLASMGGSPQQFGQAVASLKDAGKLDAVLETAAGRSSTSYWTGGPSLPSVSYQPETLTRILDASAGTDLATRTAVFESAAGQLRTMQGNAGGIGGNAGPAQATADAMSRVLTREEATQAGLVSTPQAPPEVSLDANIALSQQHSFPADLPWFYDQVKGGGPWDYKQGGAQYENFGNFNYGMTAAAMGIPEQVALRAAGWAQQQAGTSRDEWGNPLDIGGSYGDDPGDQARIREGYEYYRSGLWRVWAD
jgi:hypothetical protein